MHASRQRLSFPHGPVQPQTTLFLSTSPLHSNKLHFFPSSKTFTSVARIGQRLTDKPEANFGFILLPLSIRARLLLQVRDFTKLQQRRQRERLRLRLSGGKLSLSGRRVTCPLYPSYNGRAIFSYTFLYKTRQTVYIRKKKVSSARRATHLAGSLF